VSPIARDMCSCSFRLGGCLTFPSHRVAAGGGAELVDPGSHPKISHPHFDARRNSFPLEPFSPAGYKHPLRFSGGRSLTFSRRTRFADFYRETLPRWPFSSPSINCWFNTSRRPFPKAALSFLISSPSRCPSFCSFFFPLLPLANIVPSVFS